MLDFSGVGDFEWDEGNILKNLLKHKVSKDECEECFLDPNRRFYIDKKHSLVAKEPRWIMFSGTVKKRKLTIVFTIRRDKFRVISARNMSKKERLIHEKATKNT